MGLVTHVVRPKVRSLESPIGCWVSKHQLEGEVGPLHPTGLGTCKIPQIWLGNSSVHGVCTVLM